MEDEGFEVSWKMFISPKFIVGYLVCGLVWLTITLPNLLEEAEGKTSKALLIAFWRIVAWPYMFSIEVKKFFTKDVKKELSDDK